MRLLGNFASTSAMASTERPQRKCKTLTTNLGRYSVPQALVLRAAFILGSTTASPISMVSLPVFTKREQKGD